MVAKFGEFAAVWMLAAALLASCAEPPEITEPPVPEYPPASSAAETLSAAPPSPAMTPAVLPPGAEADLTMECAVCLGEEEDSMFRWILYDSYAEIAGFSAAYLDAYTGGSTSLSIPAMHGNLPVRTVCEDAFGITCGVRLTALTLPDGLYGIGARAFAGQSGLHLIEIPAGILRIGEEAFCWEEDGVIFSPLLYMDGKLLPAGTDAFVNEKMYDALY